MVGSRIDRCELRRPDLRFAFPAGFAETLAGAQIVAVGRRAKYLLIELATGHVMLSHLGMSGSFRVVDATDQAVITDSSDILRAPQPATTHDHVVFHLNTGTQVIYNDPRRFGFMDLIDPGKRETNKFLKDLGVEPLGNALSAEYLASAFANRNLPAKAALLDQSIVAGLGNIYVSEVLHRCGIGPKRMIKTLVRQNGQPRKALRLMPDAIRNVLSAAINAGGSSLSDHRLTDGSLGYFQHQFLVYDQEGTDCPKQDCTGVVRRIVQNGRSTFYCPRCQR